MSIMLTGSGVGTSQAADGQSLFEDLRFQRGFLLSYPASSRGRAVEAVLCLADANSIPVWRLCQWATKHSLATVPCIRGRDGDLSYENEGKRVVVGGPESPNRDLILEVRGQAEYGTTARCQGESWPHLLVEQDAILLRPLDALGAVEFTLSVRLLYCTNHMAAEQYDPGLHAAQFQMFLIVRNISPGSADHGDYFWFGVPFFDSRHDVPAAYMARDAGRNDATGKFIYTVDGKMLGITPLKTGRWLTVKADLLPFIKGGLQEAVKRGYLTHGDQHNYAIANMNLGWEIPGTFDAAVQVRDLSVSVVSRAGSAARQAASRIHPAAADSGE
jgi:hypothetical protein